MPVRRLFASSCERSLCETRGNTAGTNYLAHKSTR